MARKKANIENIKAVYNNNGYNQIVQENVIKPVIAYTMRQTGATYIEIAEVFGVTKQMAMYLIEKIEKDLKQ